MAKEKIDKLEEKKKELEQELQNIHHELDDSLDKVRSDVSSQLAPTQFIKRHPLPIVGLSVLTGFLLGNKKSGKSSGSSDSGLSTVLISEIKRLVTKKGISLATDYMRAYSLKKKIKPPANPEMVL